MIDTHSHLFFKTFYDQDVDSESLIRDSKNKKVQALITVSTTLDQLPEIREINTRVRQYGIAAYYSIGVHPHDVSEFDLAKLRSLIIKSLALNDGLVAIGECGLDFFKNLSEQDVQREVLKNQLQVAQEFALPGIFHIRNAFQDFWKIYDKFPALLGVVHSFTGNASDARAALARNLKIGINGIVTFPNSSELRKVIVEEIPISALVLETDTPFLSPNPLRGKINSPANLNIIAEVLAEIYQTSVQEIISITSKNARELFKF